jgi:hypothetical protein
MWDSRGSLRFGLRAMTLLCVVTLGMSSLYCSSTEHNATKAGGGATSGGTAGGTAEAGTLAALGGANTGGAGGGGASAQGGAPLDLAAAQAACEAAMQVQCTRQVECEPELTDAYLKVCLDLKSQCPSRFFSPGTGYSVEGLAACTESWKTFPCEALLLGKSPDCVRLGTRKIGEPCRFRGQCASGICSAPDPATCGVCVPAVASGAACVDDEQCPPFELCEFGHCVQRQSWATSLPDGTPCAYDGHCQGLCAETAEGPRCVPAPALGQACVTVAPTAQGARRCARSQYCSKDNVCMAEATDGSCNDDILPCPGNLYCDGPAGLAPGQCHPSLMPGSVCDPAIPDICGENDDCLCEDTSCKSYVCTRYARVGEGCGDGLFCAAGLNCVNGACAPSGVPYVPAECPAAP